MVARRSLTTPWCLVSPTPEHVQGGGGELHLCGLEEGCPNHLHASRQQRAGGGRPGGPDARHAIGESWQAGLLTRQAAPTVYVGERGGWELHA